ncbi:hypothetical protein [Herminiimonas fonticola]|uniref:Uncharacterized protein n=1 Tax=Herminiimonas fonticola TaxID=303380 RepID=A0A4R6G1Q3_9BURK|nr:hypothetical protein [Herminiimonas fonticola]RBA22907.1 hypothetical protein Hfont_2949 [Herminiimonas fonticola]TDN87670.1 hypothetical protein EV677_2926 [Herminiimonas fonticola]
MTTSNNPSNIAYASYDQIPWFRKRWFAIISILVFIPAFLVIAFTGDVYFERKGEIKTIPGYSKFLVLGFFVLAIILQMA